MRMRQRRIERLLVRADAALETGSLDAAREAIDEVHRLSPETPGLPALRARLSRALDVVPDPQEKPPSLETPAAVHRVPSPAPEEVAAPLVPAPAMPAAARAPQPVVVAPVVVPPVAAEPVVIPPLAAEPAVVPSLAAEPAVVPPVATEAIAAPPPAEAPAPVETPTVVGVTPVEMPIEPRVTKAPVAKSPPVRGLEVKPPAGRAGRGKPTVPKPPPMPVVRPRPAPAAPIVFEAPPPVAPSPVPDILDSPAASAPLRIEASPASESPSPRRSRLPQAAAAILILGSLGWLAVPRGGWIMRGARATASPVAVAPTPAAPGAPAPPPEAATGTAPGLPPAVDVAVTEITPEETAPPVAPPAAADTPERAQPAALVGNAIPAAQPTTDAAPGFASTAPAATAAPRRPEPSAPPEDAPLVTVPSEPAAPAPVLARAPEPLPEPPPAPGPEPSPAATAAPPATAAADAAVAHQSRILATLGRYETAYSNLDVNAAGAVWPTVDRRALARAFEGLSSQRVDLGNCDVRVAGETAVAECSGTAVWTPKVGGGSHRQTRRWQFRLRNESGGWQIVTANVK